MQSVEGVAWLLLAAYSKMGEERARLREELSAKRSQDLMILGLFRLQGYYNRRFNNRKACSGQKTRVWLTNLLLILWKDQ